MALEDNSYSMSVIYVFIQRVVINVKSIQYSFQYTAHSKEHLEIQILIRLAYV